MATAALPADILELRPARRRRTTTARTKKQRPETPPAGTRVGPWRVEGDLGRGGMAAVYAVSHVGFGKRAALKLAHRSALGTDTRVARLAPETFLREARIVHLVDHPGVCDVFATGTFDGRPYLAMERLHGSTLGELVAAGPLPRREAIAILLELCEILAAAHGKGVVHRDLKLDNVFVQPAGAGRRVKLLDWGIARVLDEPDPLAGMVAGTLTYVSPEQVTTGDVTPATDVYALGVLAYQLLLGAAPFSSNTDLELIWKHVNGAPPDPVELRPDIGGPLATLLVSMIAKDPAARPSLAQVVATFAAGAAEPSLAVGRGGAGTAASKAPLACGRSTAAASMPSLGGVRTRRSTAASLVGERDRATTAAKPSLVGDGPLVLGRGDRRRSTAATAGIAVVEAPPFDPFGRPAPVWRLARPRLAAFFALAGLAAAIAIAFVR